LKNFFSSLFNKNPSKNDDNKEEEYKYLPKKDEIVENKFTVNFTNNGGKFLYASNLNESTEFFSKIIEENSWSSSSILCFNENIINQYVLDFNYETNKTNLNSIIFITDCEFLVAKDGSILVSANQVESHKIKDLPNNIIVLAKTSQLSQTVSKGLEGIRHKYSNNLPSNITSIKNFKRGEDNDLNFLTYGSSAKNLYLILLENL
jgi:L-lactate utilization protein LutB